MVTSEIVSLHVYPIKSLGGIALQQAEVGELGLAQDRRWMLCDGRGRFLSQRTHPAMALLQPAFAGDVLEVWAPGEDAPLRMAQADAPQGERVEVEVWGERIEARAVSEVADRWFAARLGVACRLVWVPESEVRVRALKGEAAQIEGLRGQTRVGFADGYPLLLASDASLEAVSRRVGQPLTMARFRPNVVVSAREAFEEEGWASLAGEGLTLWCVKPCARCVMVDVDPELGGRGEAQVLRALAQLRRERVTFGQNVVCEGAGVLRVGQRLRVSRHEAS